MYRGFSFGPEIDDGGMREEEPGVSGRVAVMETGMEFNVLVILLFYEAFFCVAVSFLTRFASCSALFVSSLSLSS